MTGYDLDDHAEPIEDADIVLGLVGRRSSWEEEARWAKVQSSKVEVAWADVASHL